MGICSSCEATAVVALTAKLVLPDGKLQEFDRPVKVSHVVQLQKDPGCCFVCNSDEMEFGGLVTAVDADEELQMGQLYFLLPRSMLGKFLHADDMAALAVKASNALMVSMKMVNNSINYVKTSRSRSCVHRHHATNLARGERCSAGAGTISDCPILKAELAEKTRINSANKRRQRQRLRASGGGGRGRNFTTNLGPIPE